MNPTTIFRKPIFLLSLAVASGLGLALLVKDQEAEAPAAPPPSPLQAMLSSISSEPSLNDALQKFQAQNAVVLDWVKLGDAIAQWQRNTNDARGFDWAEVAYLKALDMDGKQLGALLGLAWANGGRHDFPASKQWAMKALEQDAANAGAFGLLGDAALEFGDVNEALDWYQQMMDSKPDLSSWSRGAQALWVAGDTSKAQWLMQKAIQAGGPEPENTAWCRAKLAEMLWHDGAYSAARQAVQPALEQSEPIQAARIIAAKIAISEKKWTEAKSTLDALLKRQHDAAALGLIMEIHIAEGNQAEMERTFVRLEELFRAETVTHGHSHSAQAKLYADHDRNLTEALRLVEREKLTQNPKAADTLAWVYYKNGLLPQAIEAIKRALKHGTPDAEIHFHAGLIAEKFGDLNAARRHLQKALNMNPQFHPRHAETALNVLQRLENRSALINVPVKQ